MLFSIAKNAHRINIRLSVAGMVIVDLRKNVYGMHAAVTTKNPSFFEKSRLTTKYKVERRRIKEATEKDLAMKSVLRPNL